MSPYIPTGLAAMDRAAERRVATEAYMAAHPEDRLHPLFADIPAVHAAVPVAISAGLQRESERAV